MRSIVLVHRCRGVIKIDIKVLSKDPSSFNGFRSIRILTALYLLVAVVRSCMVSRRIQRKTNPHFVGI